MWLSVFSTRGGRSIPDPIRQNPLDPQKMMLRPVFLLGLGKFPKR
ncbi:hypothetical protein D1AOALGA4SA_974 [Olavius algarvensis Delta 1 endosymbiont]|nr:hypothetical protein D1AOALGA4SA_974 [Olavius algarvensis Delta 1 endosymbiont]